ncbi:NAD-dependent protein deacetylase sirtuin-3-like isoform X2 [Rana temporaria]|nr:NAD-dependent protein deacetylase sirtuin-3-like isoform X2 [Rana temporaria]XP_040201144.1 NAD-dependent protein deacetylase sirtuin-3-like isoform X2 [Rana temporaria]
MKSAASVLQSPKMATEYVDKRSKPEKPSTSSSSRALPLKSSRQKSTTSKTPVNPVSTPEDILTTSISRLSVSDKQGHTRTTRPGKSTLERKNPETKGVQSPPLKCSTLLDVADLILKNVCKKIIIMAGAGISTPSGILDFRTPGSGLYDNLKKYKVPYPEAIFDIDYFTYNPKPFFTLAKELYPGKYKPNYIHYFVRLLHEKGLLLRCYTQNIDGLERMAGIPSKKIVEAHGTFSSASCHLCYTPFPAKEAQDCIMSDNSPRCNVCHGVVKPDIVFFGEDLPKTFYNFSKDFPEADLLIVMGTSLEVEPFANIVKAVRPSVPRLLINRDLVGPFKIKTRNSRDVAELGDLCDITRKFVDALNWQADMEEVMRTQKS